MRQADIKGLLMGISVKNTDKNVSQPESSNEE